VGLNSLKSLNLTKLYPNNNNKVKSKPLELYELAGNNRNFGGVAVSGNLRSRYAS
jgi:hypothetical protein